MIYIYIYVIVCEDCALEKKRLHDEYYGTVAEHKTGRRKITGVLFFFFIVREL